MIVFLFGYSGCGKSYFSDLLEQQGYKIIRTSDIVKKYGIQETLKDSTNVLNEMLDIILKTDSHVVIDGIRQFDLYEKIIEQITGERYVRIFIDNFKCIENLLQRGLNYEDAFNKLVLDHELGLHNLRQVSDSTYEATHTKPSNERLLNYINEVVNKSG